MNTRITVFLSVLLLTVCAHATPLTVVQTLGGDEGDILLHNPSWIRFAADGSAYVLNEGECQVLRFDADWELLDEFGRCGEGPGEFSSPTGMIIHHDDVWVFELARITVFGLDGEYKRTMTRGNQLAAAEVIDGRIFARLGAGDRTGVILDENGDIVEYIGDECPVDFFSSFKECRNVQILPHPDGMCLLSNLVDGRVAVVGDDGLPHRESYVIDKDDDSVMSKSDDGESVTMQLSLGMGYGCRDAAGRYWFGHYEGEDDPMVVTVLDASLERMIPDFEMPEGVSSWMMFPTPAGRLLLVSTGESTIYVCDVVEEGF